MARKDADVPGNALETHRSIERIMLRTAKALYTTDRRVSDDYEGSLMLRHIKIKSPGLPGGEWFAVIAASIDGEAVVAFHSAPSFLEVVEGVCARINNGSLRWKVDQYANE